MARSLTGAALVAAIVALCADSAAADDARVTEHATQYAELLTRGPTALTAIAIGREWAKAAGFREVDLDADSACDAFAPGDALVFVWHERTALFVRVGTEPLAAGVTIVGAHSDAPALRVTPDPAGTGTGGMLTLKVRAYGGIKPYQYRDRALMLVGRVVKRDGTPVDVRLGPDEGYTFAVSSLSASEDRGDRGVYADRESHEEMTLVAAASKEAFAAALNDAYGLTLSDLEAAELYAVPTERARDVGLDRALIGGYGQDDRALSYAALRAVLELQAPAHTAAAYLVDREEIGSIGRSGAQAPHLEQAAACLARGTGTADRDLDGAVRDVLAASMALSTDVKSAINPNWDEVQEATNAPILGGGPTLVKYTGHAGKRSASDAHPELARYVEAIAEAGAIPFQRSETGKVDEGGGGTIAKFLAARGINVLDVGIPLLSMHAPFELADKRDLTACVDLFLATMVAGPPGD